MKLSILLLYFSYVYSLTWNNDTVSPFAFAALSTTNAKPNADGSCYVHTMAYGESCNWLLDKFTNIKTLDNLEKWNKDTPYWEGCTKGFPLEGDKVCVSEGGYPTKIPKPDKDGVCTNVLIKKGDTCGQFMREYEGLTEKMIEEYNKKSYGWKGCRLLQIDQKICLGPGDVPKPKANPEAECGPTAPGDLYNTKCPLNACCSEYGFCGLTSDFCDKKDSTTNAPGTTGCFSNCGYGNLGSSPASTFKNIIYWLDSDDENLAFNPKNLDDYTHVYYAFVPIKSDFSIDDSRISRSNFLSIKPRKIASFGGWDFSTNPSTYKIFRDIVNNVNTRETFANNVVNFINKYNLDGIDIDWEYPAAQDIPDIPADYKKNGNKYLELLKLIKSKLPSDKLLTIAIPSSYWYLKGFPVKEMQDYVNWFVFMTYDIYGSWDLNKDPYARCHTDKTMIEDAIKMATKAGVKTWKLMGGIANYGRTFKGCQTENCKFSGGGKMGPITKVPGFLAESEIDTISDWNVKNKRWTNETAMCDFMTYNGDSIVAWPKKGQRESMTSFYKDHGLGGTVTWVANYFKHDKYNYIDYTQIKGSFVGIDGNYYEYIGNDQDVVIKLEDKAEDIITILNLNSKLYNNLPDLDKDVIDKYISAAVFIKNNKEIYEESIVTYASLMINTINALVKEVKTHDNIDKNGNFIDHDELKKRAVDLEYLNFYNVIMQVVFSGESYSSALSLLADLIEDGQHHWANLGNVSIQILRNLASSFQNPTLEDIDNYAYYLEICWNIYNIISFNFGDTPMIEYFSSAMSLISASDYDEYEDSDDILLSNLPHMDVLQYSVFFNEDELRERLDAINDNIIYSGLTERPVYVMNIHGDSQGAAANAVRFLSDSFRYLSFESPSALPVFRYIRNSERITRNRLLNGIVAEEVNYNSLRFGSTRDRDEFPMNAMRLPNFDGSHPYLDPNNIQNMSEENYTNIISIAQVDALENRLEGANYNRFISARPVGTSRSPTTTNLVSIDYSNLIPNDEGSSSRSNLNYGDLFYLLILVKDENINNSAPKAKRRKFS